MRKLVVGLTLSAAVVALSAVPARAFAPLTVPGAVAATPVQWSPDWREREDWRRREEWRAHEERRREYWRWRRAEWERAHSYPGYGQPYAPNYGPYYGR